MVGVPSDPAESVWQVVLLLLDLIWIEVEKLVRRDDFHVVGGAVD
jgi:hypothetical protein